VGGAKRVKRNETVQGAEANHLRATRLRSRPSSNSTSIGSLSGKTTAGGGPALFEAFALLVLLVRRLEVGIWEGIVGDVVIGESIIIMTACLRLAPAERGSTWLGMLEKVIGAWTLSIGTDSRVETAEGVGDSFLRFPSKKPVEWDGGGGGRDDEGEGEGG